MLALIELSRDLCARGVSRLTHTARPVYACLIAVQCRPLAGEGARRDRSFLITADSRGSGSDCRDEMRRWLVSVSERTRRHSSLEKSQRASPLNSVSAETLS